MQKHALNNPSHQGEEQSINSEHFQFYQHHYHPNSAANLNAASNLHSAQHFPENNFMCAKGAAQRSNQHLALQSPTEKTIHFSSHQLTLNSHHHQHHLNQTSISNGNLNETPGQHSLNSAPLDHQQEKQLIAAASNRAVGAALLNPAMLAALTSAPPLNINNHAAMQHIMNSLFTSLIKQQQLQVDDVEQQSTIGN